MSVARIRIATSLILITSILLLPGSLVGQTSTAPMSDWSRLAAVESGSKLSIKLKDGKKVEGKLNNVLDTGLSLSVKNKTVDVKREEVRSVHQVKKKSAGRATLIGLGVGAGVGAAAGAAAVSRDDGFLNGLDPPIFAGLTVLGAGGGALMGFLIGKTHRTRVLIYATTEP